MTLDRIHKIIDTKVVGVWKAAHDEKGHHYRHTPTGIFVDSVTTKIIVDKPHLVPWAAEVAVRNFIGNLKMYDPNDLEGVEALIKEAKFAWRGNRDDAGLVGNRAHDVVEDYLKSWIISGIRPADIMKFVSEDIYSGKEEDDHRLAATSRSFQKFFLDNTGIVPIATELLVGDVKMRCAGTLDNLVLWDGMLWLLDWKTSNSPVHDDYAMQVATYKKMFENMTGLKIVGTSIVGISKSYDNYRLLDLMSPSSAHAAFRGQARTYDWLRNGKVKLLERKNRAKI